MRETFLGVRIDRIRKAELLEKLRSVVGRSNAGPPITVAFVNAHSVECASGEPDVEAAFADLTVAVPDGISIVTASRIKGGRIRERFSGIDTLLPCLEISGARHFFVGSSDSVLARVRARIDEEFPAAVLVGSHSPPMWPWDARVDSQILGRINDAKPDFVWVGLSAPKQELWIHRVRERVSAGSMLAIGYAFDTFAGTKQMAPRWVRRMGVEWLWRLAQDPGRVWRRVFITGPRFLFRVSLTGRSSRDGRS